MREISEVHFTTQDEKANKQLIDQYVEDAVDRLPTLEFCDRVAFMPLAHHSVGGPNLWLTVAGDRSALVNHESGEWDALVTEGVVSKWDVTDVTEEWYEKAGERGGELLLRLHAVANQATKAVREEFEEPPAPVNSYPNEGSSHPIGWWQVLHIVTSHQRYSFEETADVLRYGLQHTYEDIATFESTNKAVQQLEEDIQSLETFRNDLIEQRDTQ
jgi:hypothetical protein